MINIRTIQEKDYSNVETLIKTAFAQTAHGYDNEAELVEKIRKESTYQPTLELVAEQEKDIIGHGLLSEVTLESNTYKLTGLCLAPLCVSPDQQNKGIGSALLKELEQRARQRNYPFISILGHPEYYQKFNYVQASQFDISSPFPVPAEAYLIKELSSESLKNQTGTIHYSKAFN